MFFYQPSRCLSGESCPDGFDMGHLNAMQPTNESDIIMGKLLIEIAQFVPLPL
jgi:hypothetical protein